MMALGIGASTLYVFADQQLSHSGEEGAALLKRYSTNSWVFWEGGVFGFFLVSPMNKVPQVKMISLYQSRVALNLNMLVYHFGSKTRKGLSLEQVQIWPKLMSEKVVARWLGPWEMIAKVPPFAAKISLNSF